MSTHIAFLQRHDDHSIFKLVPVPQGQSLEFDEDSATRRWLHPHLGSEWHLCEFVARDQLEAIAWHVAESVPSGVMASDGSQP